MNIKISRIYKCDQTSVIKAFVDILVNDSLLVKGIRIISGKRNLFVSMPRERGKDGRWYEIVRPVDKETRDKLSEMILEAYNK